MKCRMCKSPAATEFLNLGFTPPADQFITAEQLHEPETYYPLDVVICDNCGLVQLDYIVPPEILYCRNYPYESSITRTGQEHWNEFAATVVKRLNLSRESLVVDVGSNVGVLLGAFKANGTRILGVEPAANIAAIACNRGIDTLNMFFNLSAAREIETNYGKASLITATNVFAHIDDLDDFMYAVDTLLTEKGIFIFEAPYLVNLINSLEYDTIYHEHLSYLSVKPLIPFLRNFGMEIFHIEERDIHGGSFRVYIGRTGKREPSSAVNAFVKKEIAMGLYSLDLLKKFSVSVERNRQELIGLLQKLKMEGKTLAGVSAPAKGMTLINFCRIGPELLDFVTEKSKLKIGCYTPGMHIPVVSDDVLLEKMPDYVLLLAWNFADEIIKNLSEYRARGGKFIIPLPNPRII